MVSHSFVRRFMTRRVLVAALVGLSVGGFAAAPRAAHAQSDLKITNWDWVPGTSNWKPETAVFNDFFNSAINQAWADWRPTAWDMVKQYLSRPNAFAKQMSARDMTGHLGDHIDVDTQIIDGEIVITCRIPNNYFQFYVTTPDVALGIGVDRAADPKMEVFADFTATLRIPVDGIMENLRVTESSFAIKINKIDSQNFTGDVALFLTDTITSGIKLLGGPDYWAKAMNKAEKPRDYKDSVNAFLGPVNARLATLKARGYDILSLLQQAGLARNAGAQPPLLTASVPLVPLFTATTPGCGAPRFVGGDAVTLEAYKSNYGVPLVGPGIIRGTISWDKSLGMPERFTVADMLRGPVGTVGKLGATTTPDTPKASGGGRRGGRIFSAEVNERARVGQAVDNRPSRTRFLFEAEIQTAPGQAGMLFPPGTVIRRYADCRFVENGSQIECQYSVRDLPYEVPLKMVRFTVIPGKDWAALNPQPLPPKDLVCVPQNWEGTVMVKKWNTTAISRFKATAFSDATVRGTAGGGAGSVAPAGGGVKASTVRPHLGRARGPAQIPSSGVAVTARANAASTARIANIKRDNPTGMGSVDGINFHMEWHDRQVIR